MIKIKTRLFDVLNIKVPIIQAPVGAAVNPKFASAVSNYGALGVLPLGTMSLERAEAMIDETLSLTNQPLAANLILEWDQHDRLQLCLEKGIKTIWFFWGDPSPYVETIHKRGAKVMLTVGSADEAKQAVDRGIDIIVAQGWEAGGHIWGNVATMALVPAVIDAIDNKVPIVTAGGVADGRGLAANLALGAEGVVMGTRLLASHEANIHQEYKDRIIQSKEIDTVYTEIFDKGWPNAPVRVLRNSTYDQWLKAGRPKSGNRPGEQDIHSLRRKKSSRKV